MLKILDKFFFFAFVKMNRILLEKTEELTLYILQLEERLKKLEDSQNQKDK